MKRRKNPNMEDLLLIGGAGLLAWYALQSAGSTTTTPVSTVIGTPGASTSTTGTTTTGGSTQQTTSTGTSTGGTTAGTYPQTAAKIQAAAVQAGLANTASADQWNYLAVQVIPGFTAPAPEDLFPAKASTPSTINVGLDQSHDPVTFSTWWAAVMPYLPTGLSGLAAVAYWQRRSGLSPYGGWRA